MMDGLKQLLLLEIKIKEAENKEQGLLGQKLSCVGQDISINKTESEK